MNHKCQRETLEEAIQKCQQKVCYESEMDAEISARNASVRYYREFKAYLCRYCNHWHLTRIEKKFRKGYKPHKKLKRKTSMRVNGTKIKL